MEKEDSRNFRRVATVGRGNAGDTLLRAFQAYFREHPERGCVTGVNPHEPESVPADTDICLIAVSDNAIAEVASRIPESVGILAHVSGTTSLDILGFRKGPKGVFYPLQTMTKGRPMDFRNVTFFIEGDSDRSVRELTELARLLSPKVIESDSEVRKTLHVAAVFCCNFLNRMIGCAEELLEEKGLPLDVVRPLVEETVAKAWEISPSEGQTGPARRGDTRTINAHLAMLRETHPELVQPYSTITESILKKYRHD